MIKRIQRPEGKGARLQRRPRYWIRREEALVKNPYADVSYLAWIGLHQAAVRW